MISESKIMRRLITLLLASLVLLSAVSADIRHIGNMGLNKANTLEFILYDANQIRDWIGNNGHIVSHIPTGDAGLEWPKGSGLTAVFASGLWVAGMVDGEVRSAAAEYTSEFQPGTILYDPATQVSSGPDNPNDARFQVSSINKGDSGDLTSPNFNREYATWPAADGAPAHDGEFFTDDNLNGIWDVGEPFDDFNADGVYEGPDGAFVSGEDPPQMIGDQMHWFVINDAEPNMHSNLWSTQPLGIEVQTTVFGFDRADPLGNVMFLKWLVINKSGHDITDTYISIWSDADLGDAVDDYVGCDTALSVGYFYNGTATDLKYGSTPPAVGYDFFQGPIVPSVGDTALVSGRKLADYKNLPMTSFDKYTNGSTVFGDPETAVEAYNYMKGLTSEGEPWHILLDPSKPTTKFLYPGDPNTQSGWTEYDDDVPGDRRSLMSSGPFTMETWQDTDGDGFPQVGEPGVQEVVSAIIIAKGTNNTNAIDAMKFFDQFAQGAYDAQFKLPSPPSPEVLVSELDQQIILSWENDKSASIEAYSDLDYNFEGYNVYQGESENGPWKLIATYDVPNAIGLILDKNFDIESGLILEGPVQFGTDSGVQRLIDLRRDELRGNIDLINGRKYYFAVTSYAYSDVKAPKTVESSKTAITVRPHAPALGLYLDAASGDSISFNHTGIAEAAISAEVIDPLQLTGESYAVDFAYDSTTATGSWIFGTLDAAEDINDTMIVSTELDAYASDLIDGFILSVADVSFEAPKLNTSWEQTTNIVGTQVETAELLAISPGGVDSLAWTDETMTDTVKLDTLYGPGFYYDRFDTHDIGLYTWFTLYREVKHDVRIQSFASNFGALGGDRAADIPGIGGGNNDIETLQSDLEIRFTEAGQNASVYLRANRFAPNDSLIKVPFEVWDIERNIQLCIGIADNNRTGGIQDTSQEDWEHTLDLDWVVVFYQDYATYGDSIQPILNNPNSGWCWEFNSGSKFSIGDVVQLKFLNPVKAGEDRWVLTPSALVAATNEQEQDQLDLLNVFPNPYFAFNVEEKTPLGRFVTFTHLPEGEATIRIYSLGGHFVNRLDHGSSSFAGTSFEQWDLTNQSGIPVASGMYIVHIEIPGVGERMLKLAIFQPEERLDIY